MRIIVSAGGTGGHIYPALAIINKLKLEEKSEILFIGTHNRMEKDLIPKENIPYQAIEIYGFNKKRIFRNFKNIFLIIKANYKCKKIMQEFKPDAVIGVGGYVTYPVIKAAYKLGIKTFIHEQNSIPGKTNKVLAKYANVVFVSFAESAKYFPKNVRVEVTGNPCGERALTSKPIDKITLGLKPNLKLVLIVSGSLGSQTINKIMKEYLFEIDYEKYEVLYITGKDYYDEFINNEVFPSNVKVVPYIGDFAALLKRTDLIVTRAGASTISEILATEVPSILIPSPYVSNNHQYFNALELEHQGVGVILLEGDLTSDKLKKEINHLLYDKNKYQQMKNNFKKIDGQNSSEKIYLIIKELVK